jgi:hypothetical protein
MQYSQVDILYIPWIGTLRLGYPEDITQTLKKIKVYAITSWVFHTCLGLCLYCSEDIA